MFYKAELLDALHYILFNTYVQFAGKKFLQTKGIPMGGNASPFIADLCLAWAEYKFMNNLLKSKIPSDHKLALTLSNNCRYIDDISVINYLGFGELSKKIYHEELLLEESDFGYHYDNFLDLSIRIHAERFIMGIYHKVDDFNFEVINFPFPESNIHSKIGYNAFYSQLIRFFRLCNNTSDFCSRVKLLYSKLYGRGFSKRILTRYFLKFCSRYPVDIRYGYADGDELWQAVVGFQASRSCSVFDYEAINEITRPCNVVVEEICSQSGFNPDPSSGSDESSDSESFGLDEVTDDTTSVSGIRPQSLDNPSNHCYVNSCLQVIYRIFMHFTEDVHFNSNRAGYLVRGLVECIYSDSAISMSRFKQQLARFDQFFDGSIQRDVGECFYRFLDVFHQGTKQNLLDASLNTPEEEQLVHSLSKRLFLFNLKHKLQCLKCRLITTSNSESRTYFVYPSNNKSISQMFHDSLNASIEKSCGCCNRMSKHEEVISFEQPPEILVFVISRFGNHSSDKNRDCIEVSKELNVSSASYALMASIHHHGRSISSGHYTCNVFYPDTAFLCNDNQILALNNFSQLSDSVYMVFYSRYVSGTS